MSERRRFRLLPDDPEIGRTPCLWLGYLVFVFMGPVFMGRTDDPAIWIATFVSLAVFVPLYFAAYWLHGTALLGAGLAICAIGAPLSAWSTGANTYYIYGAYFAGMAAADRWTGLRNVAFSLLVLLATVVFVQPSAYFWIPAAAGQVIIGLLGVEFRQRLADNAHLRMAQAEVEALARIAERERIARDLHDLLGQSLSVVALKAELATRLLDSDPTRAAAELQDIHEVARQSLSEVRTAVHGYRVGNGAGLRRELDNARRALQAAGVELHCDADVGPLAEHLDAEHEAVVALALREGVTNVVRHAGALQCHVRFVVDPDAYGVEIRDDGRGGRGALGAGLSGMRERVESLGGRFELQSEPGTTIRLLFARGEAA